MTALAPPVRRRPAPAGLVIRTLLARNLQIARWFWLIVVLAAAAITLIWLQVTQPQWSVLSWARQAVLWFSFSQAIVTVTAGLPAYVAAGLTRRAFARGAVALQLIAGVGNAVVLVVLMQAERLVHGALGWGFTITDAVLDQSGRSFGLLVVDYAVTFTIAGASGLLVGAIYLRGRAWWGTLTLPLTVGPVLVFGGAWGAALALGEAVPVRLAVLAGAGGATLALLCLAATVVVRGTQLRTTP